MQASSRTLTLDEVVLALTGAEPGEEAPSLEQQTARAARLFDPERADEACRVLLEAGAGGESDPLALEALVVLALAHPDLVERHALEISTEGLRLAELLEQEGDSTRAADLMAAIGAPAPRRQSREDLEAVLTRSTEQDEVVEQYVQRAKSAARMGRTKEAITWLREALLVDRSRPDIARMIRDLRYAQTERRARWRGRARKAVGVLVLGGLTYLAAWREVWVDQQFHEIPAARDGDEASLAAREQGLDALLAKHVVWLGALGARRELADLRMQLDRIALRGRAEQMQARELETQRRYMLDSALVRGRASAEGGDYAGALDAFRHALELGPPEELRGRLQADVEALEAWLAKNGEPADPEPDDPGGRTP